MSTRTSNSTRDTRSAPTIDPADLVALSQATHGDPFSVLGPHARANGGVEVRVYVPGASAVSLLARESDRLLGACESTSLDGLFVGQLEPGAPYRLQICWPHHEQVVADAYAFPLLLGETDLYLIGEGSHRQLGGCLGAQAMCLEGVDGVRFAVWAPNAQRVAVVGDFNGWDTRRHGMRCRFPAGVWEIFVPGIGPGERYKFALIDVNGEHLLKADPVALSTEPPPLTASVVADAAPLTWHDEAWMASRHDRQGASAPISIYEVHAGSWRKHGGDDGAIYRWQELAEALIPYVVEMGFTHIELMPIMEYPFGGSWGYQPLSLFAPSGRFGSPAAFAAFIDACHVAGIGVILDWVPGHFPSDSHGLARFDGTALYEYAHPFEGYHQDWNTYIYNLGRREVHGFMLASALHWLRHFHLDGLRVDAVASMLYRNYSRQEGEWIPNRYGGTENLEAVAFLQHLNEVVHDEVPGAMVIAEESTAWPGVTAPVSSNGLGFSYKWNMGWMHDSLDYIGRDPLYRGHHHDQLTFGLIYAFDERFVLPISHDEVVHGKGSLLEKMPGDIWQRFANLRAYLGFMWLHPGKKLLFMGCELAQWREWSHDRELDWELLQQPEHAGIRTLVGDLNSLYRECPALHERDCESDGFSWIIGDDRHNSVYAWWRHAADGGRVLAVANLTPRTLEGYRIGVPLPGRWQERFNTDAVRYGGSNVGNGGGLESERVAAHGEAQSLVVTLPPLGVVLLLPAGAAGE
ncbi:1,4-alpha-glucan branching protein GlgB [Salinicola avicenniae]|uniref:1,4-alpha-glucan branching protein GlgB n=1 Tax=Salinicola avicenniae TaxID=2916836 RepID=UPI002073C22F|nr:MULTISPECIES: 1,4-alpha-glucan branching protein GlgB [unclassified Salinicola]